MIRELLTNYGYPDEKIEEILSYMLPRYNEVVLYNNIIRNNSFFESVGYTKEQIIKMTSMFPIIFSCRVENLSQKIDYLMH